MAILGAARDGPLAHRLAAAGACVMSSVGTTTTMLVISEDQPFGRFVAEHADHRRADELRWNGTAIRVLTQAALQSSPARADA